MRVNYVVGLLLLSVQAVSLADGEVRSTVNEQTNIIDLTAQQYRVESLQNEQSSLKKQNAAYQASYHKQASKVKALEKSLLAAKQALAQKKAAWEQNTLNLQAFNQKLSVEEHKLNQIWNDTHRERATVKREY